ncbi:antitoxin VapB [Desulfitispora alkaliphila]|uniref:M24 family metallopeptidase n=1 Tax=Desulfitispora alkaliphila TaxID=622674 RepID=UPI003D22590F
MALTELFNKEINEKESRIAKLMATENLDGICLFKFMNFSWFTSGGTNRVVTGSEAGCAVVVIIEGKKYIVAPSNEINRIMTEQVMGQGFEPVTFYWYEKPLDAIKKLAGGKKLGTDMPKEGMTFVGDQVDRLRFSLTPNEVQKAKIIGAICSFETSQLCADLRPGITEYEITANLSDRLLSNGIRPAVLLVGTDERIVGCRHPVPTDKALDKYALISLVGEKDGLHVTLTRAVHFGSLPSDLREKQEKVARVDAVMIDNTRIGANSEDPFKAGIEEFAKVGYPEEWKNHHQGGAIGYAPREFRAGDGREETIVVDQMFGWNPTLQGTKSEDTVLTRQGDTPEVVTPVPKWWPVTEVQLKDGNKLQRPMILEV